MLNGELFRGHTGSAGEVGYDGVNRVKYREDEWCRPPVDGDPKECYDASAAAITTLIHVDRPGSPDDGRLLDADIELNGVNFAFTVDGTTRGSGTLADLLAIQQGTDLETARVPLRSVSQAELEWLTGRSDDLDRVFDDGAEVTLEALVEKGLVKNMRTDVKILGQGELTKKLQVSAHAFSASARQKIDDAGGTVTVISPRPASGE